jgi:hypothetical protein
MGFPNRRFSSLLTFVVASACLTLVSCSSHGVIHVKSTVRIFGQTPEPAGTKVAMMERSGEQDLKSSHYREYALRALESAGFVRASPDDATLLVTLAYGRGEERQRAFSSRTPIFGQTGVSATHTTGRLTPSGYGSGYRYSGTTSFTPTFGVTGWSTSVHQMSSYDRWIVLEGYRRGARKPHWRMEVDSSGPTGDLHLIIPYLLIGGAEKLHSPPGSTQKADIYAHKVKKLMAGGGPELGY